jgi:hypothetical protein
MQNNPITGPVIIDVTKAALAAYPGHHVIKDQDGRVIALCPLFDELVCEGQFSFAPAVQRAINVEFEPDQPQEFRHFFTVWQGGDMPVKEGTLIEVRHRSGNVRIATAGSGYATRWIHNGDRDDIVAFRVI